MTIETRSMTAMTTFNDNKNALDEAVRTFKSWNDDMPNILRIAHSMGLRYDHHDNTEIGRLTRVFSQWVRSKDPLVNGQLFNGVRLADITFVCIRDYNHTTFEVYENAEHERRIAKYYQQ